MMTFSLLNERQRDKSLMLNSTVEKCFGVRAEETRKKKDNQAQVFIFMMMIL
jgi:hypothetical protein